MDIEEETRRFKRILRFGIGLLISSIFVWTEFTYVLFGKRVDATITDVKQVDVPGRRGRTRTMLQVS